ncbi:MAG: hypothetical protein ABL933_09050 [Methyloglobulus sp.]
MPFESAAKGCYDFSTLRCDSANNRPTAFMRHFALHKPLGYLKV